MIEEFDNKHLQDFAYETTILSQDGRIVGSCELGKATIQMLNKSNQYSDLKGTWIKTIHGSFYIYDVKPVQEKINIKLECYDIKYKLNTEYNSSLYTFPMTLKGWRNAIFTNCGVEYDDSDFPNSDLVLNEEPSLDKGIKNIQVISLIAEAGASNVITDANDIFYFSWLENVTHVVKDWLELITEKTLTSSINAIVLGRGTGDDIFYPNPTPENSHIFRIDNNYILDPQSINEEDRRSQVIEPIYNRLNGFCYIPYSMRSRSIDNKLTIKLGQKISYSDIWGNNLTSIVMTKKIHWLGGNPEESINYEISLSAEECSESNEATDSQNSILGKINDLYRKADKQNGIIEDFIEEIDGENGKLTQVTQTVSGFTQTVSDTKKELEGKISGATDDIENLKTTATELQQLASSLSININNINQNGVNRVVTTTGYRFDENGLNISKTGEQMDNTLTHLGMYVKRDEEEVLGVDKDGVRAENAWIRVYLGIGKNSRIEDYMSNQTGIFYTGDD